MLNSGWEASVQCMELHLMLCYDPEGEMGIGAGGRLKREGIYTYIL